MLSIEKKMNHLVQTILCLLLLIGCSKEEAVPVVVDFELDVFKEDYSIPVQVVIINKTKGAQTYQWNFEGAVPNNSSQRNPGFITYDTKGVYTVVLIASNQDGSTQTKEVQIKIDAPVVVDFNVTTPTDTFSPASFSIENLSTGTSNYTWTFEGGIPSSSNKKNPGNIIFKEPGEHTITLEATNGKETYNLQKTVEVAPYLEVDFSYEVNFEDDDFEIPVEVKFNDSTTSVTSYLWVFEGAVPSSSTLANPEVTFNQTGTHSITLTATNGKETKSIRKEITVTTNNNLRVFEDIKLGINTAHNTNATGSFYSISERKVYTASDLEAYPNAPIDLVFFGLNNSFSRNSFVSPDALERTTFASLSQPRKTRFINTQELCACMATLSASQFDMMNNDQLLKGLEIKETPGGVQPFDHTQVSRIILFQTEDGRKGAIKIKEFKENGENSHILIDIKVQKEAT